MVYVGLVLAGLIILLLLRPSWRPKVQLYVGLSSLVISGFMLVYLTSDIYSLGDSIQKGPNFFSTMWEGIFEALLYFAMILGMAAKYLFEAIGEDNSFEFRKWQFLKPFLVSPIVFGVVYGTIDVSASKLPLFIFSFQNGFFWQTILAKTIEDKK